MYWAPGIFPLDLVVSIRIISSPSAAASHEAQRSVLETWKNIWNNFFVWHGKLKLKEEGVGRKPRILKYNTASWPQTFFLTLGKKPNSVVIALSKQSLDSVII